MLSCLAAVLLWAGHRRRVRARGYEFTQFYHEILAGVATMLREDVPSDMLGRPLKLGTEPTSQVFSRRDIRIRW